MPSSDRRAIRPEACAVACAAFAAALAIAAPAEAQAPPSPQGFAVERLAPSAPGAGWLVMDDLDLHGGLGGALSFSTGYAHAPLRVTGADGRTLPLVEHQLFFAFGAALTYDRFRLYLDMSGPLLVQGQAGTVDGVTFAPGESPVTGHACEPGRRVCADLGWNPDVLGDPRLGFDARLFGAPRGPLRLGLGWQLVAPSGARSDYLSDGTFRTMVRVLGAGDWGRLAWAAHVGGHVRPLDEASVPGSPRGSELLFGGAAGVRFPLAKDARILVGPEVFGASALRALFTTRATAVEGLLTTRYETGAPRGPTLRFKAGLGAGLAGQLGAPEWRAVVAVETFARSP